MSPLQVSLNASHGFFFGLLLLLLLAAYRHRRLALDGEGEQVSVG